MDAKIPLYLLIYRSFFVVLCLVRVVPQARVDKMEKMVFNDSVSVHFWKGGSMRKLFSWLFYFFLAITCWADNNAVVLLSLPGLEKKVGVRFNEDEVKMVALYQGNNLYLRPIASKKLRFLLGKEKAVAPKVRALSLPSLVAEEAARGRQKHSFGIRVSGRSFPDAADTFAIRFRKKMVSGHFREDRGNPKESGIVLFLKEGGTHIYQLTICEGGGIGVSLHTLSKQQSETARKSVERKLAVAGEKLAAEKINQM